MVTGILSARLLSADGRGEFGAIQSWALTAAVLGGLGFREAATMFVARQPERAPRVLTTTAVVTAALAALAIVVTVALVPLGYQAQSDDLIRLAQLFMLWIVPLMIFHTAASLLAGFQDHRSVTLLRIGEPLVFAVGLVVLWQLDQVSLVNVLVAHVLAFVSADVFAIVVLTRRSGWGRPERRLVTEGFSYGLRAHGHSLGQLANSRLDLVLLPAFAASDQIGRYVVAVSAASVVVPLFGYLNLVVFPAAARLPKDQALELVQRTVRLVIVGSIGLALPLGIAAPWLLRLVYGPEFEGGATPMRILLPGLVLWAAASITAGGLKAIDRPGAASIAQLTGFAFTLVALFYALPRWGIIGAAVVSSLAYALVFVIECWYLHRNPGFSAWRLGRLTMVVDDAKHILAVRAAEQEPEPAP